MRNPIQMKSTVRRMRRWVVLAALAVGLGGSVAWATIYTGTPANLCSATAGGSAGQCASSAGGTTNPGIRGVAVDQSNGNVYVVDGANFRIDEFSASGGFVQAWGRNVVAPGGQDATAGTNDVQEVHVAATTGTFTLKLGTSGTTTTSALNWNATALEVEKALELLTAAGTGDVKVSGGVGDATGSKPYVVEFIKTLAATNVAQMTFGTAPTAQTTYAVGTSLSCTANTATNTLKVSYRWLRNGVAIEGATSSTYITSATSTTNPTTTTGDAGSAIQCQTVALSANNAGTTTTSIPATAISPSPAEAAPEPGSIGAPALTGSLTVGSEPAGAVTLTCKSGGLSEWTRGSSSKFQYQWYRNGVAITAMSAPSSATTEPYTVTKADLATAAAFRCAVTDTNVENTLAVTRVSASRETAPAPNPTAPAATSVVAASFIATTTAGTHFEVCNPAASTPKDVCQAGLAGNGAGELGGVAATNAGPVGIAVDSGNHRVFVTDSVNARVEYFDGVSGTSLGQITSADLEAVPMDGIGVDTSGATHYVYVAGKSQLVDKFAESGVLNCQIDGKAAGTNQLECYTVNNDSSGTSENGGFATIAPNGEAAGNLAIDSSGNVYIVEPLRTQVTEYDSTGAHVGGSTPGPFTGLTTPRAVAVNSSVPAHVFVATKGSVGHGGTEVLEFNPSSSFTVPISKIAVPITPSTGETWGIAVDSTDNPLSEGNVNIGDIINHAVWSFAVAVGPPLIDSESNPVVTPTSATLEAQINPNGRDVNAASETNPPAHDCQFEYTTDPAFIASIHTALCENVADLGAGFGDVKTEAKISGLTALSTYYYRAEATNSRGLKTGTIQSFGPPAIDSQSSSAVTQTSATLEAQINPNGVPTTYHFQYVDDAHYKSEGGFASSHTVTTSPESSSIGSDNVDHLASKSISPLTANTTYDCRVVATNSAAPSGVPGASHTVLTLPATPVTEGASVTQTTAMIAGSFNAEAEGNDTHYYFEYGPTAAYGYVAPMAPVDAGTGTSVVNAQAELRLLRPLTEYHYRLVVADATGRTLGPDKKLETLPPIPNVFTGASVNVGTGTATLMGSVNPEGATTTYRFQYGTSTSYGLEAPAPEGDVSSEAGTEGVTVTLTELEPDTVYHYRLVATNSGGTGEGEDRTFTTNASGEPNLGPLPAGFSLTPTGAPLAGPAPLAFPDLSALSPLPPPKAPVVKPLTRAQKLAKALKQCKKIRVRRRGLPAKRLLEGNTANRRLD